MVIGGDEKVVHQRKVGKAIGPPTAGSGLVRTALMAGVIGAWLVPARFAAAQAQAAPGAHPQILAQDAGDDDKEVPPTDVEKYIKVYKAMQKDRGLSVDQAAQKEGLTVAQFRTIEGKIERDDALREHVRKALRPASAASAGDESD
jgi:hypothetical protein